MRIRKRFPPPSLSFSDPQLPINQSSVVAVQVQHPNGNLRTDSQPSDPPNHPLLLPSDQPPEICSDEELQMKIKNKEVEGEKVKDDERWREEEKGNDTRKESLFGDLPPSGSDGIVERWIEGDKVIPLKKRRGSFGGRAGDEETKKMKAKMKSKTNKKCLDQDQLIEEQEEIRECKVIIGSSAKKSKRGSVILEGSRCSRVNGRGWRCCQQTLVGYSLCEHHLGKGRLRSMTSVRSRVMANTTIAPQQHMESQTSLVQSKKDSENISLDEEEEEEEDAYDDYYDGEYKHEKKPLAVTKKRMKLGMVKARSISSLLNQTNSACSRSSC